MADRFNHVYSVYKEMQTTFILYSDKATVEKKCSREILRIKSEYFAKKVEMLQE